MTNIPQNKAIELLKARLDDLKKPNTDLKALKSRIQGDIIEIFGRTSQQYLTSIGLEVPYFTEPERVKKYINNYRQTIEGWIEFIEDFQVINAEKAQRRERGFEDKYNKLLKDWNGLVPEYKKLAEDYETILKNYDEALGEVEMLKTKIANRPQFTETIKILFLGASPVNEARLRSDEEQRDIENGLQRAALREQFDLRSKWAVTTNSLQQAMLDENPNIVHFSGHGHSHGIALEDALGNSRIVSNDAIGSLFELFSTTTICVVLNSCYSESQAHEISKHIPYVIGMKSSVADKAAIAFAVGFYAALGAGKDIPFAFRMGTVAIKLEGVSGSHLPVLLG